MAITLTILGQANLGVTTGAPATIELNVGVPGSAGTVTVGTTTTGAPGSDAIVENVGTATNAILDFTIPRGDQGIQGQQGEQGEQGVPGAKGDKGDTGAGVAAGGSTGQFLSKASSDDYDTQWVNVNVSGYLPLEGGTMTGSLNVAGDYSNLFIQVTDNEGPNYSRLQQDGTIVSHNDGYSDLTINASSGISMPSGSSINFAVTEGNDLSVGAWGLGVENSDGSYSTVEPTSIHSQVYYPASTNPDNEYPAGYNTGGFNANGVGGGGDNGLNNYGWGLNNSGVNGNPGSDMNWGLGNGSVYGNQGQGDDNWSLGLSGLAIKSGGTEYGFNLSGLTFADGTVQTTAAISFTGGTITDLTVNNGTGNGQITIGDFNPQGLSLDSIQGISGQNDHLHYGIDESHYYLNETMVKGGMPYAQGTNPAVYWSLGFDGLHFPNNTTQTTAFPPAGGTTSQYIDGTGGLVTFPTVGTAGKMTLVAYNATGATIPQGSVVYISGAHGNDPQISLAKADSEATSAFTIAVAQSSVPNNSNGTFITTGLLEGFATNGFGADGTPLYLSPTVAGGLTATKPFAPYHYVRVGTVVRSHPTAGTVFISIINGFQLDEMSDVASTAPLNNNVLTFETSSGMWKDKSVSTALGYAPANQTLGNLTSSSTARTNLGLGTMAVETASNYLTTATAASVYTTKANNLSDLASSSTARTNLGLSSLATASFATNAESNKGTSASVALTPANALWTAMSPALHATTTFSVNNASTGGTGGTSTGGDLGVRIFTGTTAASYGAVRNGALTTYPTSRGTSSAIDWSKIVIISGTNLITPLNSVATNRFLFGTTNTGQVADLANRGIGMRQIGTGAIELQVHNGTTLTNVTSSFTPTNNTAFDFMIYSDGVGNATLYINDSSVATSASAPTGSGATTQNYIGVGSEISANVASQTFYSFGNIKTYIGR